MLNMKSKVKVLLTNKISRSKVIGRNGKKRGGYKVGEIIMMSVKEGEYATNFSRKGSKHKAIIAASRYKHNSLLVPGIKDIIYNNNHVMLIDNTKKTPLLSINSLNMPIHSEVKHKLEQLAKSAKRKDVYNFSMV